MTIRLDGSKFQAGGQEITAHTLSLESEAWKRNIQTYHRGISTPGIVCPEINLVPRYYSSTAFSLTSGHAYLPAYNTTVIGSSSTQYFEYLKVRALKESVIPRYADISPVGIPSMTVEKDPIRLDNILLNSGSPTLDLYKDPSGNTLLTGSATGQNYVWAVYHNFDDRATLSSIGSAVFSEVIESFKIAVTTVSDYMSFAIFGTAGPLSQFLRDAFTYRRAILLGVITPEDGILKEDSFDVSKLPYYPSDDSDWPYPYVRPEFSLVDITLESETHNEENVLGSFPSRYIENRYYSIGNTGAVDSSYYGDITAETGLGFVTDTDGSVTGIASSFYMTAKHFPYHIISLVAGGKNYSTHAKVVPFKKYITVGDGRGVPVGTAGASGGFTLTYGWMNIAEPYLDTVNSKIVLNQPIENEIAVIGTTPYNNFSGITKSTRYTQHYPAEVIYYLNQDGYLDYVPRLLFTPNTVSSLVASGAIYPTKQPTIASKVAVFVATDAGSSTYGASAYISGVTSNGVVLTSPEVIGIDAFSTKETRIGLGTGGADWVGNYAISSNEYLYVSTVAVSGSGAAFCSVLSLEGINGGRCLPVCSLVYDVTGGYEIKTFKDLRRPNLFQGASLSQNDQGIFHTDGTIVASAIAGEYLERGSIVYMKTVGGSASQAFNALSVISDSTDLDQLQQVQVLGVVYPKSILQGEQGDILCRGVFGMALADVKEPIFSALTPGVICLSREASGAPMNIKDMIDFIKYGDKPYTPVVRVIEAFGTVLNQDA